MISYIQLKPSPKFKIKRPAQVIIIPHHKNVIFHRGHERGTGQKIKKAQNTGTYELLEVFPVLPVEAPIRFPDPIPPRVVLRPSRKEDHGVVGLNLAAEIQLQSVRSIAGGGGEREKRNNERPSRRGMEPEMRYRGGKGEKAPVSIIIVCATSRQSDRATHRTS